MRVLIFSILFISIALQSCSSSGNELHVSPSGKDSNAGTENEPLKTISAAASLAQAGDVITVHGGI